MSKPSKKFGGALQRLREPDAPLTPAVQPETPQAGEPASPQTVEPVSPQPSEPATPKREKYTTILDTALVKRIKLYAVNADLKDREVVEQAVLEYLERMGG